MIECIKIIMTRILVTKWLWKWPYSENDMKETEKHKPHRYIVASGNIFEKVHIDK